MALTVLCYPKCSTCAKAVKWLDSKGITYTYRDIVKDRPDRGELTRWIERSGLPVARFFNTSGQVYRELGLKDRLGSLTDSEKIELLASDGKLVKRPLLVTEDTVRVGFKEDLWQELVTR